MRTERTTIALLLALAALAGGVAGASAGTTTLPVHVNFLVGHPPAKEAEGAGVVIVPGTVVLAGAEGLQEEVDLAQLKLKLIDAYRLADVDTRAEADLKLAVNREETAPTGGLPVDIRLTLLGFDDKLATFRVQISERGKTLASPTVSVARNGRGIVGGRNGAEAPYFFLVIEPEARTGAPDAQTGLPQLTIVKKVDPVYPEEAKKNKVTGGVILELLIDKQGAVADVKVVKSADAALSKAAIDAVRQWRYQPPKDKTGAPHEAKATITIQFRLE